MKHRKTLINSTSTCFGNSQCFQFIKLVRGMFIYLFEKNLRPSHEFTGTLTSLEPGADPGACFIQANTAPSLVDIPVTRLFSYLFILLRT